MIHCTQQRGVECGILAVGNIVCFLYGISPGIYLIDVNQCREHYGKCLIEQDLTLFPGVMTDD